MNSDSKLMPRSRIFVSDPEEGKSRLSKKKFLILVMHSERRDQSKFRICETLALIVQKSSVDCFFTSYTGISCSILLFD